MILDQFDLPVLKFFSGFANHCALFDRIVYALVTFDIFRGVAFMALFWFAWFYQPVKDTPKQQQERQISLLVIFFGSIVLVVLSRCLQLGLDIHHRPLLSNLGLAFPSIVDISKLSQWNSFPSDHAVLFFALATGFWRVNREAGIAAFLWVTLFVGLPRIYTGYHYPSDIIGGAIIGIISMLLIERLPVRNMMRTVWKTGQSHPAFFYAAMFLASEQVAHLFDDLRGLVHMLFGHA